MLASLETATEFVTSILHKVRIRFEEDGFLHPRVLYCGAGKP